MAIDYSGEIVGKEGSAEVVWSALSAEIDEPKETRGTAEAA